MRCFDSQKKIGMTHSLGRRVYFMDARMVDLEDKTKLRSPHSTIFLLPQIALI